MRAQDFEWRVFCSIRAALLARGNLISFPKKICSLEVAFIFSINVYCKQRREATVLDDSLEFIAAQDVPRHSLRGIAKPRENVVVVVS